MFNRLRHLAARLGLLPPPRYPYPALDVHLRSGVRLHLVASIHMGNAAMSPLPEPLLQRVRRAQALIVEADITRPDSDISSPPQAQPLSARSTPRATTRSVNAVAKPVWPLRAWMTFPCGAAHCCCRRSRRSSWGCAASSASTVSC